MTCSRLRILRQQRMTRKRAESIAWKMKLHKTTKSPTLQFYVHVLHLIGSTF